MSRLQALERALAELPSPSEPVAFWPKPVVEADGVVEWTHPQYYQSIRNLFDAFNKGAFGFAAGDRKYLTCLEAWEKRVGKDPFDPANADALDREACLLILRCVDRTERFGDGEWASAHSSGILHAALGRLIEIERMG